MVQDEYYRGWEVKPLGLYTSSELTTIYNPFTDMYRMVEPFWFIRQNGEAIPAPRGMVTDFCSIPWWAQWLFSKDGPWKPAGGIHDILCQGEFVPIPLANLIFKEALEAMRVIPAWRVALMYKAVQIGTAATYRKHTLQSVVAARKLCRIAFDHQRPLWPDGKLRFV